MAKENAPTMDELASTLATLGLSKVPQAPNTHPTLNVLDIYRSHISELLGQAGGVEPSIVFPALQWTATLDRGDLQLAVPALRVKRKDMKAFAQELAEKFPESPLVQPPVVTNTWMSFFFKPQPLTRLLLPWILKSPSYGFNPNLGLKDASDASAGRKKVVIEFSSPNIAKPFHAGHLRSTIIGGFLANLHQGAGWDVVRMNYLGDWGKQYGVLAVGFERFGSEEELVKNPIGHLYDVYVKISQIAHEEAEAAKAKRERGEDTSAEDEGVDEQARKYFKRMVDGDEAALGIWRRFRDLSIEKYKATYARLNIRYDEYSGESQVRDESMEAAAKVMQEKSVSEESEGAIIVDLKSHKLGKAIIQKKDGTSLYLTRDIAAALERYAKYGFDKMLYVVASQQDLHLAQLFKIIDVMGRPEVASRCQHINFGMVMGMSTRKGTAKFLDDILRDVGDKMHEVMRSNADKYRQVADPDRTADVLAISAVMVQDMKGKRVNNYTFDMERMTSFEGDTGPYLQYAHARLCSIQRKAMAAQPATDVAAADWTQLGEAHAANLTRQLAVWPDIFANAVRTQEPTTVLTYLFKMVHALSSSYDHLQVVTSDGQVSVPRLALYMAAQRVLANGMKLLGLDPVERM